MEENNMIISRDETNPVIAEVITEFNKNYSTGTMYNELITNGYTISNAIEKVCHRFDVFCSHTSNVSYIMERYTELYNHSMITKPMATSLLALMISLAVNIGFSIFESEIPSNTEFSVSLVITTILKYLIPVILTAYALKAIFKEIKHTYSSYDVFVLSYERERIYKELVNRGYTVPEIKE